MPLPKTGAGKRLGSNRKPLGAFFRVLAYRRQKKHACGLPTGHAPPCPITITERILVTMAGRPRNLSFPVPQETRLALAIAARARGLSTEQLALVLLSIVVNDGLLDAVLDDSPKRASAAAA
jgi:hypothetical protein